MVNASRAGNMGKRAIIYARVSTDDQAEHGYSLPSQVEACRAYAAQHGFEVVAEPFQDDYTGTKLDRPAFTRARELIDAGGIDAIIVLSSDRLTRRLAHSLLLRDEWKHRGVELHYVKRGKLEDTPEARMTENIEGVFNEYWQQKIAEATRRGVRGKVKAGKVLGGGGAPYGYRYSDGQLIPHEREAQIVQRIFEWYVIGDENGRKLPAWSITKRLSTLRIPTPSESNNRRRRKQAPGVWNVPMVCEILGNETYAGTWHYGKRAKGELIAVSVPALVDRDMWERAQVQAVDNKRNAKGNTKRPYLLRRRVTCGRCGRKLSGVFSRGVSRYACNGARNALPGVQCRCTQPSILVEPADDEAWRYVLRLMTGDDFEAKLRDVQARERARKQPKCDRLQEIAAHMASLDAEADRIAGELASDVGERVKVKLKSRSLAIDVEIADLEKERKQLQASIASQSISDAQIESLMQLRREVQAGIEHATFEDKERIFEGFNVTAVAEGYILHVTCRLKVTIVSSNPRRSCSSRTTS
jgi:site-specific DNA recombinase